MKPYREGSKDEEEWKSFVHIGENIMLVWIISVITLVAVVLIVFGYQRVRTSRQANFEGIESPETVEAYNRISRWPQFKLLRRLIVREIRKYHPEGVMVDVGCGPGYLVEVMSESFPHLRFIGVDIAEEMIQKAASNPSFKGVGKRVEFRQGDVQKLPFEDNAVDFVVSTLSLHHWSQPNQALQEICRVLKPQGQFLIFDLRRDARRFFYWLLRFAQTFVVPRVIRSAKEPTGSARAAYTPDEAEALLSGTPFRQCKIKRGFGWMFIWGRKDELERL